MPPFAWSGKGSAISGISKHFKTRPLKAFVIFIKGKAETQRLALAMGSSRPGNEEKPKAKYYLLP